MIDTENYKSNHKFDKNSFQIFGFKLTDQKTIPENVLRRLASNRWFSEYSNNPFMFD